MGQFFTAPILSQEKNDPLIFSGKIKESLSYDDIIKRYRASTDALLLNDVAIAHYRLGNENTARIFFSEITGIRLLEDFSPDPSPKNSEETYFDSDSEYRPDKKNIPDLVYKNLSWILFRHQQWKMLRNIWNDFIPLHTEKEIFAVVKSFEENERELEAVILVEQTLKSKKFVESSLVWLADRAISLGKYSVARDYLKNLVLLHPDNPTYTFALAQFQQHDPELALLLYFLSGIHSEDPGQRTGDLPYHPCIPMLTHLDRIKEPSKSYIIPLFHRLQDERGMFKEKYHARDNAVITELVLKKLKHQPRKLPKPTLDSLTFNNDITHEDNKKDDIVSEEQTDPETKVFTYTQKEIRPMNFSLDMRGVNRKVWSIYPSTIKDYLFNISDRKEAIVIETMRACARDTGNPDLIEQFGDLLLSIDYKADLTFLRSWVRDPDVSPTFRSQPFLKKIYTSLTMFHNRNRIWRELMIHWYGVDESVNDPLTRDSLEWQY